MDAGIQDKTADDWERGAGLITFPASASGPAPA
jgi:hypothetical protein